MIFITLGSQKFQFNRLLKKIDNLIEIGVIQEEVFAQIGYSNYKPKNYSYNEFMDRDKFAKMMKKSDIVITHGGTGAIITAVKAGKKVIAVPRLKRYGEHVDDHQVQLLKEFYEMGFIAACYDLDNFEKIYSDLDNMIFKSYVSNTKTILDSIREFIEKN
ncbi:PssE/Cps14G family polysaccharide biosynthesis glycosyltransferase [Clostridium perfringens]|uniref:PssE/Cps14G family polysaccharide biosynthesis glycosyltransferase n=2 Tax=Clostridium perfringens TaxID=1502 RepID=UPI000D70DD2A|nr:PssE/Cps14G family polysaccharide biosynthesis glycosyltransferase [Clostridium perfringens]MDU4074082.1 PssE/Cps14G family polysaccharide biosynthesis glycosyltransferase [Clostridium perfringens]PWX64308.1 beta(1,3)galactosyltransferase EpsH [Clostridium perfringens]